MPSSENVWYRLGFALERARHLPRAGSRKLAGLEERAKRAAAEARRPPADLRDPHDDDGDDGWTDEDLDEGEGLGDHDGRGAGAPAGARGLEDVVHQLAREIDLDEVLTTTAVAMAARTLDRWRPGGAGGLFGVIRAAGAGAAAALFLELVRPVLRGEPRLAPLDEQAADRLLAGAGQGLIYGSLVEHWLPGPPLLKGAAFGGLEHTVYPMGGLRHLIGSRTALGQVPALAKLLEGVEAKEHPLVEHLLFGMVTALLYGPPPRRASRGTTDDDGD